MRKKRNKKRVKARSALAYSVKVRLSGAGKHTDKRLRRNPKGRKVDPLEGWE